MGASKIYESNQNDIRAISKRVAVRHNVLGKHDDVMRKCIWQHCCDAVGVGEWEDV